MTASIGTVAPDEAPVALAFLPDVRRPPGGGTIIRISHDAHPDRAAHVELEAFDGPLALLLNLIEQRHMDILDVPLGELAGAYLEALAGVESEHMPHISSFIAVASQLILIKSRAILPRPPLVAIPIEDGPDPETALRERLLVYRQFRDAGLVLRVRLELGWQLFHREAPTAAMSARDGARPADEAPLDPGSLAAALAATLRFSPQVEPPTEMVPRLVTLEERAAIILAALRRAPMVVLQDLLGDLRDRALVAVTFLAMLELVKSRELSVEQDEPFGPIRCRALSAT